MRPIGRSSIGVGSPTLLVWLAEVPISVEAVEPDNPEN
jgi:hypothetical protein